MQPCLIIMHYIMKVQEQSPDTALQHILRHEVALQLSYMYLCNQEISTCGSDNMPGCE